MKKKIITLSGVLAISLMTGCQMVEDQNVTVVDENVKNTEFREITVDPIASMSFGTEPSEAEIRAAVSKQRADYNPAWGTPGPGEKMVTIMTKTGSGEWDGSTSPKSLRITYDAVSVNYILDNPATDEGQAGQIDIFVYHVKTGEPWDILDYGVLKNAGDNAWRCEYATVREDAVSHYTGDTSAYGVSTRFEKFNFNAWIETDSTSQAPSTSRKDAVNTQRLGLR